MNEDDKKCVVALIKAILAKSPRYEISVSNGEDDEIQHSRDLDAIVKVLDSTGEDCIAISDPKVENGTLLVGWFSLIYNNGSEGEPMIAISDYSANDYCDMIYDIVDFELC